jgi:hypothetical protein
MKTLFRLTVCLSIGLVSLNACSETVADERPAGPDYATAQTKEIILKMVAAHGGMEAWRRAPSVSYDNIFFNPYAQQGSDPWWVVHEQIEQGARRVIQDWSIDDGLLVYDGEKTWTKGYEKGNPPTFMVHFFYYFTQLPWLTQDDGVRLGAPGRGTLPLWDGDLITIDMTFSKAPAAGKTARDSYKLYIDPASYLLAGYEYTIGYGALVDALGLPPEQDTFGPMLRVHHAFDTVDELTVPTRMSTWAPDGSQTYGHHVILNYSYSDAFDESRLIMPADGVVDEPRPDRAD